jgi:hypothetical protein
MPKAYPDGRPTGTVIGETVVVDSSSLYRYDADTEVVLLIQVTYSERQAQYYGHVKSRRRISAGGS